MIKMSSQKPKTRQEVVQSRTSLRQRLVLVGMCAGLALVLFSVTKMAIAYRRVRTQRVLAQAELMQAQEQYKTLSENVERLSTPRGREEELRTRYRAVLPGETLVVVLPQENVVPAEKPSFWKRTEATLGNTFQFLGSSLRRLFGIPDSDILSP
jgi:cell division protein FtsB